MRKQTKQQASQKSHKQSPLNRITGKPRRWVYGTKAGEGPINAVLEIAEALALNKQEGLMFNDPKFVKAMIEQLDRAAIVFHEQLHGWPRTADGKFGLTLAEYRYCKAELIAPKDFLARKKAQ